ncbi:hypothetical protein KI387_009584, partial [Taxus chinensis]
HVLRLVETLVEAKYEDFARNANHEPPHLNTRLANHEPPHMHTPQANHEPPHLNTHRANHEPPRMHPPQANHAQPCFAHISSACLLDPKTTSMKTSLEEQSAAITPNDVHGFVYVESVDIDEEKNNIYNIAAQEDDWEDNAREMVNYRKQALGCTWVHKTPIKRGKKVKKVVHAKLRISILHMTCKDGVYSLALLANDYYCIRSHTSHPC